MVKRQITAQPLTKAAFAPFGDVIDTASADEDFAINNGTTRRFHALAQAETDGGETILSIFRGQPFVPPVTVAMMERHPLGTQAFMPLDRRDWLVVVAPDVGGRPGEPVAFLARGDQGVQYGRNIWHHPLLALGATSEFLIVDRSGPGDNLEEQAYRDAWTVALP